MDAPGRRRRETWTLLATSLQGDDMPDPTPRRALAAESTRVVSFRAPREDADYITKTVKRIALDNDEAAQDIYLRALTEFIARESYDSRLWRSLRQIAEQRGQPLTDVLAQAVAEFVRREKPGV